MRDVFRAANEGFRIFGGVTEFGLGPEECRTRDSDREDNFVRLDDPSLLALRP
ncbi:hypothetical protein ACWAT4_06910 [Bradyrhizobium manausense]